MEALHPLRHVVFEHLGQVLRMTQGKTEKKGAKINQQNVVIPTTAMRDEVRTGHHVVSGISYRFEGGRYRPRVFLTCQLRL